MSGDKVSLVLLLVFVLIFFIKKDVPVCVDTSCVAWTS